MADLDPCQRVVTERLVEAANLGNTAVGPAAKARVSRKIGIAMMKSGRLRRVEEAVDVLVLLWVIVTLWLVAALPVGALSHRH